MSEAAAATAPRDTAAKPAPQPMAVKPTADVAVERAARWLRHESVVHTPAASRRAFLESKGLSAAQIDAAILKAEAMAPSPSASVSVPTTAAAASTAEPEQPAQREQEPRPATGRSTTPLILAVGGIGAAIGGALALALTRWRETGGKPLPGGEAPPAALRMTLPPPAEAPATPSSADTASASTVAAAASPASPASLRAEASLAGLRALQQSGEARATPSPPSLPPEVEDARKQVDCMCAASADGTIDAERSHALHTLVVLLSHQLKHPTNSRYHRLNVQNASHRRLLSLGYATDVLRALGFEPDAPEAAFWVWRGGGRGPSAQAGGADAALEPDLPTAAELDLIRAHRDMLSGTPARLAAKK